MPTTHSQTRTLSGTRTQAAGTPRVVLGFTALALLVGGSVSGCLSRDLASREPATKAVYTIAVNNAAVDKIDILLAIDNSSSMTDKQKFLAAAVPKLVGRFVTPNCINAEGKVLGASTLQAGVATCAAGKPEFQAISDIHIGVVTSSLGSLGGSLCGENPDRPNNDDRGQLINRDGAGGSFAKLEPGNFLAWYPPATRDANSIAPKAPYSEQTALAAATQSLVRGAGEKGCGLEAQLESVYHFLIAPDPWESIQVVGDVAKYSGLDTALLKQRAAFLRPDSLVAVIMLTDEDDSSADPLSVRGRGFRFAGDKTTAPGTSACAVGFDPLGANPNVGPNDPRCQTCIFGDASDPSCKAGFPGGDKPNVRFFHMKQRYGVDPQYPIDRYVGGLSRERVPARGAEHDAAGRYIGDTQSQCTNPLFAKKVYDGSVPFDAAKPEQGCTAALGNRAPGSIFFAIIGGVPNELLQPEAGATDSKLSGTQWERIVGRNPLAYDYSGIDPRMVQSITPRAGRPAPTASDSTPNDPLNTSHRDWNTQTAGRGNGELLDLQYACTFPLPPEFQRSGADTDCTPSSDAPLCKGTGSERIQVRAKAYPTVRQLLVARALGDQGIAASLCPQETADTSSELYGYTPAVSSIVDRLKTSLSEQCLPRKPSVQPDGSIECLMLEVLPEGASACDASKGKRKPDAAIEAKFRERLLADGDGERARRGICEVSQVIVPAGTDCSEGNQAGWCYVQNKADAKPAGRCGQKVQFQRDTLANGSTVFLQCIDQTQAR